MSDKKKITMLDLVGSPSFNYTAAAESLNTAEATSAKKNAVKNNNRRNIHIALAGMGFTPGPVGAIADFTDAMLYGLEGKYGDAALSMAAILPFVGAAVNTRLAAVAAKKSGDEFVTFYKGIEGTVPDSKIIRDIPLENVADWGEPVKLERFYFAQDKIPDKMLVPSSYKASEGINPMRFDPLQDPALIDAMGRPAGISNVHMYATTSPQTALWYANNMSSNLGNNPIKIIKYEVPVDEIKKMSEKFFPGDARVFSSNDYFLKKLYNIGTGRPTKTSLVSDTNIGFRNIESPFAGIKNFEKGISPGNNVSIFERGFDSAYATILKGDNIADITKKYPELLKTEIGNPSIIKALKKRGMSLNQNDYDFMEFR